MVIMSPRLYPFPVELRSCTAAVALQRALFAGRVRARKGPVLPSREPAEDLGRDILGTREAQVCLHSGKCIGRQARALFDREPDFVVPVEFVRREGDEAVFERGIGVERLVSKPLERRSRGLVVVPGHQPGTAVYHFKTAEIERGKRDARPLSKHIAAVGGEAQLAEAAGKARAFVDDGKEAARRDIE